LPVLAEKFGLIIAATAALLHEINLLSRHARIIYNLAFQL
jgi:hypothetical protein